MSVKQVIILRKDLNMRKGKMVAQGAHASMSVFLHMNISSANDFLIIPLSETMQAWVHGSFTKIVVSVDSETELLHIYQKAQDAHLPCSIIQDNGLTEFKGIQTYTAVAIGPAESADIDLITAQLKLL